ncbi:MAG: XdhC family protein [Gaiellaceae bacterium]
MKEIRSELERWRARGDRIAFATVVSARRSAPRPIGSKLAISERGELAGSVSGGCVESELFAEAQEVLAGSGPRLRSYGITDELAASVGLPCGGEIEVFVEETSSPLVQRLLTAIEDGERAVHLTAIEGERLGEEVLVLEGGETLGSADMAPLAGELFARRNGVVDLPGGGRAFADVYGPPPRLVAFGAIDTAEALCAAARLVGWRTAVVDARATFATPERLPSADEIVIAWPEDALAQLQPDFDTAIVVLTHDEKFDVPALAGALATDAFYIGALGSRRAQAGRRERLLETGIAEAELARIFGPCGLDIGADTPAETAISILAEMLAVRAGRSGGPLREAAGRIHAGQPQPV